MWLFGRDLCISHSQINPLPLSRLQRRFTSSKGRAGKMTLKCHHFPYPLQHHPLKPRCPSPAPYSHLQNSHQPLDRTWLPGFLQGRPVPAKGCAQEFIPAGSCGELLLTFSLHPPTFRLLVGCFSSHGLQNSSF